MASNVNPFDLTGKGNLTSSLIEEDGNSAKEFLGNRILNFELVELLAVSQFSWVFKATRASSGVTQHAVVKLLAPTSFIGSQQKLFEREKMLLAKLSHPGIATFIDAGVTDTGLSFIIMEYVEGTSLTDYCNSHNLDVESRLSMISDVLSILDFAHSKLVIHRDLKPSNIIVTSDGFIKLLDFGIGKLIDDVEDENKSNTQVFTPKFVTPEQIANQMVSVSTDLYQIGLLIHQLLIGRVPFDHSGSFINTYNKMAENKPVTLKKALANLSSEAQKQQLIKLGMSHYSFRRDVSSELEKVTQKALEFSPSKRYLSAQLLKDDINAVIHNRPVSVMGALWTYRMRKWFERNVYYVLSVSLVILLITAGVTNHIDHLQHTRQVILLEAKKTEDVASFLTNILKLADLELDEDNAVSLDYFVASAEKDLAAASTLSDDVKIRLALIIASAYTRLQDFAGALRVLTDHTDVSTFHQWSEWDKNKHSPLLLLTYAQVLYDTGNLEQSKQVLDWADTRNIAEALDDKYLYYKLKAEIARRQGDNQAALNFVSQAEKHIGTRDKLRRARMLENLKGGIYISMRDFERSIGAFEKAIALSQSISQNEGFTSVMIRGNLAILYSMTHRFTEAQNTLTEAINIVENKYPNRASQLASLYNTLGMVNKETGVNDAAIKYFKKSVALYSQNYGWTYSKLQAPLENLVQLSVETADCPLYTAYIGRLRDINADKASALTTSLNCSR